MELIGVDKGELNLPQGSNDNPTPHAGNGSHLQPTSGGMGSPSAPTFSDNTPTRVRSSKGSRSTPNLASFAKKVRMGKRIEKALSKDKSSSAQDRGEEDPNKTPDVSDSIIEDDLSKPHLCTGHFHTDFHELCRREGLIVIPPVIMRGHRPPSPSAVPAPEEKAKGSKKDDKKKIPSPEPEPEPELDENGEPVEPPPKTYTTKDKFEYFKPSVQVEMDNPDKEDTVTQIFIRGWKLDSAMMNIFKQCWVKLDRLHTINLWNTGLTDESLQILSTLVLDCPNLKTVSLDNNPVQGQGYHQLLHEDSPILHLSLRYNQITEKGAELIGRALGTPQSSNQKLISLNLSGNQIEDQGAEWLAKGLRTNRTLLSLALGNNQISNKGAIKLAEVLSKFELTHEEIVERRKLQSEKSSERQKSECDDEAELTIRPLPTSRRGESRDRPGSVRGKNKQTKSAKDKKDNKKDDHDKTKGKKEDKGKKGSIVADGKTKDKGKTKGKTKTNAVAETEIVAEPPESSDIVSPLLDYVESMDKGVLILPGNRTLINLSLTRNLIEDEGIKAFLLAIGYQTTIGQDGSASKVPGTGLMRLCLEKNRSSRDCDSLTKLKNLMQTKDPFYKPPILTPDLEH